MTHDKIKSVDTVIVDLPMRRLQRFAALGARHQSVVIIRIKTEHGVEGIGEAVTPSGPWWGGESVESIKMMIDSYMVDHLVGADPFAIEALLAKIERKLYGNPFAKAGVEMALLDIQGKTLNIPLYNLFGGKQRDNLVCSWPLATGEASAEIDEAEEMIDAERHNVFKLKLGALEPADDVARACAVARGLAGKARVRVDPNEEWSEADLKWAMPRLEEAGIDIIEQPLPRWNLSAHARLTERTSVAVMIDEGLCSAQDMFNIATRHAADLVSLKIMKSGGMLASRKIASIAESSGISLYMGTFLESSIGTAANMQFCASLADLPYGGELSGPGLIADDLATEPAKYKNFALQVPDGVGIGVQIDEDKLAHFRRDKTTTLHAQPLKTGTGS